MVRAHMPIDVEVGAGPPLWLVKVDPETGHFAGNTVSLGARGDSYHEYLLKQWLLSGKTDDGLLRFVFTMDLSISVCCPGPQGCFLQQQQYGVACAG